MSLHQTTTLLDRDRDVSADSEYSWGGYVRFSGSGLTVGVLWLDRKAWVDMGRPDQITSVVRPGDTLNEATA